MDTNASTATPLNTKLSHLDAQGKPRMVDVGSKHSSQRSACASAQVVFPEAVFQQLMEQQLHSKKGAILDVAQIAGIMAAKQTAQLIPMCHPLPLENCELSFEVHAASCSIEVRAQVSLHHKTGVEMEALTAASVAALTIYDMCKALSPAIRIENIHLVQKTGGKHDYFCTESAQSNTQTVHSI